jgi:hypothetical protein
MAAVGLFSGFNKSATVPSDLASEGFISMRKTVKGSLALQRVNQIGGTRAAKVLKDPAATAVSTMSEQGGVGHVEGSLGTADGADVANPEVDPTREARKGRW